MKVAGFWRALSALMAVFAGWAAAMQLNDPDPLGWFLMYGSVAVLALATALAKPSARTAALLAVVALVWAAAILPELLDGWSVRELGATMSAERPEVEFGREFVGLLILAVYCATTARLTRQPG